MKTLRLSILPGLCMILLAIGILLSSHVIYKPGVGDYVQDLLTSLDKYNKKLPEDRVYLQFDKPMYKPGETIWFSAYIREATNFSPSKQTDILHVELINPKGGVEKKIEIVGKRGLALGDFQIGEAAVGGMYKVRAYTTWQKNDPNPAFFEKALQVQKVILPRLKMKLDFIQEAYGPGDEVSVELNLNTNENEALGNYAFNYVVNVDGNQLTNSSSHTGSSGDAILRFQLPHSLKSNDGLVNVMINYQGQTESISRSIPIVLNQLELAFFPEGGDLVNNLKSRVGFKAVNEFGQPADITGYVVDERGVIISQFESFHQGMGAFEILPRKNSHYEVVITRPRNISQRFQLPKALSRGYGLEMVSADDKYLRLNIHSTENENLTVMVNVRGKNYSSTSIDAIEGENNLTIPLRNIPVGVAQVTLFDRKGIARAERLAFVNQHKKLNIEVETNKEKYQPREVVKLKVKVKDERGMPMPADLSLAVADDQLLSFADDKSSNILSWMLMEADLADEVYEPNFYFKEDEEKAELALDYLLMTNGWRRYTWKQIKEDEPVANIAGERAVIGGVVMDRRGFPMPNALVEVAGSSFTQRTDENGHFHFYGIDLMQPKNIIVKGGSSLINSLTVSAYANDLKIWAVPSRLFVGDINGEGIPFASIVLKGTKLGTTTDFDGWANIEHLLSNENGSNTLQISYVGYNTKELDINSAVVSDQGTMAVMLDEGATLLESVVVTGAGVRRSKNRVKKAARNAPIAAFDRGVMPPPPPPVLEDIPMDDIEEEFEEFIMQDEVAAPKPVDVDNVELERQEEEKPVMAEKLADKEIGFAQGFIADDRIQAAKDQDLKKPVVITAKYYQAREFATPMYDTPVKKEERTDFRSTIYWNGHVEVGRSGEAELEFYTSDAITSFNVTVEGISGDGMIGRAEKRFFTQLPFALSVKMPIEVLTHDEVAFPVTVINNTDQITNGTLDITLPEGFQPKGTLPGNIKLEPREAKNFFIQTAVKGKVADSQLAVRFTAENGFEDAFSQPVTVVAKGFPASLDFSGQDMTAKYPIDIRAAVDGTVDVSLTAYPSTLSELMSGLESMLREPHGCFEQTSSSTYPNILVLQYLKATEQDNPEITKRAKDLIKRGYKKLVSFESPSHGFEWFGGDPAHEGLTAYGLMEFLDMQKVWSGVDQDMIDRTIEWLLSRRDGNGLFKRNPRALHQFGLTDNETMSAYITYSLSEAGYLELDLEAERSFENALSSKDPYLLGLAANTAYNYNQKAKGKELMDELMSIQLENGRWEAKGISAPGSSGNAYNIETAALALLGMMKQTSPHPASVRKVADFISNSRGGYGGFGNTNSTVLALRALVAYAGYAKRTDESGTIEVYVDGSKVTEKDYEKGTREPIVISGLESFVKRGKQEIEVKFAGAKTPLPYTVSARWRTALPASDKACIIGLTTEVTKKQVKLGETVRLTTTLENKSNQGQPMTIAIVGIPAGLSLQPWQLKELLDKKQVDFYEIIGNNLVLYYRQMAPSATQTINLDLKADIVGSFHAPASSAYLYYTDEHKEWTSIGTISVLEN
ncbi:MAG: MG2 domain-containing protein [Bacteroidota bacterium]